MSDEGIDILNQRDAFLKQESKRMGLLMPYDLVDSDESRRNSAIQAAVEYAKTNPTSDVINLAEDIEAWIRTGKRRETGKP